uniref:Uncharacterized protein n=1 Tax=Tetranychus urticae TaxID=32264 RepID=T1KMJ7_TETUR
MSSPVIRMLPNSIERVPGIYILSLMPGGITWSLVIR